MTDKKIESFSEVEDEQAFLKAYYDARQQLSELRAEVKAIEKERDELKTQVENVSDDAVQKLKDELLKTKVAAKLSEDGLPDVSGVIKYLNYDGVELDDEGNVTGLDERLDDLKNDLPTLFDAKKRASRSGADIHDKTPAAAEKSTTESQVDALFARR